MSIEVGSHRFSTMDARRTLRHAIDLLDLYPAEVHPFQADRRGRITSAIGSVDPFDPAVGDDRLGPLVEVVWPELLAARDDAVTAGVLPDRAEGNVVQLNSSDGGVPKLPVDRVEIDHGGVVGDRQESLRHHGSPFQALCLWNMESIDAMVAEGHPIGAGSAGENITVAGLDWPDIVPGVRLAIGSALCQISAYAIPCAKNAQWFSDGEFTRLHHDNPHPDHGRISRVYATVLEPGTVTTAEAVVLEP